jgi:peptide deformylase
MSQREILQLGDPILWQPSLEVADIASSESRQIVTDLSETLAAFRDRTGYGRGIAAPQIGELVRVIFIRMQPAGFCGPLFNPRVVRMSAERMELWDDCFSFPELMVRVSRSFSVLVEYDDERGSRRSIQAEGPLSELLQHEIDHLDGVLAIQRAISAQSLMTRSEWERQTRAAGSAIGNP